MKILQLCHKTPLPAIDGGCIAINNITQCLLDSGLDVKVLAVNGDWCLVERNGVGGYIGHEDALHRAVLPD